MLSPAELRALRRAKARLRRDWLHETSEGFAAAARARHGARQPQQQPPRVWNAAHSPPPRAVPFARSAAPRATQAAHSSPDVMRALESTLLALSERERDVQRRELGLQANMRRFEREVRTAALAPRRASRSASPQPRAHALSAAERGILSAYRSIGTLGCASADGLAFDLLQLDDPFAAALGEAPPTPLPGAPRPLASEARTANLALALEPPARAQRRAWALESEQAPAPTSPPHAAVPAETLAATSSGPWGGAGALWDVAAELERPGRAAAPPAAATPTKRTRRDGAAAAGLGADWLSATSPDGYEFVYNTSTRETAWAPPRGGMWLPTTTPDGDTFFLNTLTGESAWTSALSPAGGTGARSSAAPRSSPRRAARRYDAERSAAALARDVACGRAELAARRGPGAARAPPLKDAAESERGTEALRSAVASVSPIAGTREEGAAHADVASIAEAALAADDSDAARNEQAFGRVPASPPEVSPPAALPDRSQPMSPPTVTPTASPPTNVTDSVAVQPPLPPPSPSPPPSTPAPPPPTTPRPTAAPPMPPPPMPPPPMPPPPRAPACPPPPHKGMRRRAKSPSASTGASSQKSRCARARGRTLVKRRRTAMRTAPWSRSAQHSCAR